MAATSPIKSRAGQRKAPTILLWLTSRDRRKGYGILEMARKFGWRLLDLEISRGVVPDGYVPAGAISDLLPDNPWVRRLRHMGCPVVRAGRLPHPLDNQLPAVLPDTQSEGRLAAEHFHERGFRHVAYVGHEPWSGTQWLYDSFQRRAVELGCTCHLLRFKTEAVAETPEGRAIRFGHRAAMIDKALAELPKPLGVFTYSDLMAARLCVMCDSQGLAVPEDVALLGRGNDAYRCASALVPLSSVDDNPTNLGRQAAILLQRLIKGQSPPTEPLAIPAKGVVERHSTDVLAVPEPIVAQTLRFVWDHLERQLSVDEIAARVAVSRSTLDRAFQRCLGRSVAAERHRKRLEHCARLLRGSEMTIADIAAASGFPSKSYLFRSFKDMFGITPRKYRTIEQA